MKLGDGRGRGRGSKDSQWFSNPAFEGLMDEDDEDIELETALKRLAPVLLSIAINSY